MDEQPTADAGGSERASACRGLRGATTIGNAPNAIDEPTAELLEQLLAMNGCEMGDVAAAIFTLDEDLAGENPAVAARAHGWSAVPLLMVREHGGDARVARCLRVLLLVNTTRTQAEVRHVYLRGAAGLRPDLTFAL